MNQLLENAYIYCFKIDEKIIYIGKTHQKIEDRLEQHLTRCHNEKLKKYLESDKPPKFEIIYESHNTITEEILCSIEKSFIETMKPECNICGVTRPYDFKGERKTLNKKDVLAKKKTMSEQDIDIIILNNPQIHYILIEVMGDMIEEMKKNFSKEDEPIPKDHELRNCIVKVHEERFGKLNNFNERKYYNKKTGEFQQSAWIVRNKNTKETRFLTNEEKWNGVKNKEEEVVQGRLLFFYYSDKEVEELSEKLYNLSKEAFKQDNIDRAFNLTSQVAGIDWYLKQENHLDLYFPIKYITLHNLDGTEDIGYDSPLINTMAESYMQSKGS